jgi:hypothetical protein
MDTDYVRKLAHIVEGYRNRFKPPLTQKDIADRSQGYLSRIDVLRIENQQVKRLPVEHMLGVSVAIEKPLVSLLLELGLIAPSGLDEIAELASRLQPEDKAALVTILLKDLQTKVT